MDYDDEYYGPRPMELASPEASYEDSVDDELMQELTREIAQDDNEAAYRLLLGEDPVPEQMPEHMRGRKIVRARRGMHRQAKAEPEIRRKQVPEHMRGRKIVRARRGLHRKGVPEQVPEHMQGRRIVRAPRRKQGGGSEQLSHKEIKDLKAKLLNALPEQGKRIRAIKTQKELGRFCLQHLVN
jgi:hypothetical protein